MNSAKAEMPSTTQNKLREEIKRLDQSLENKFADRLIVCPDLSRSLVSSQGNKNRPAYRWYKYKEGFSAALVEYFLERNPPDGAKILDPFAGSGTTLFAAGERGLEADGIEIMPVSRQLIVQRNLLETTLTDAEIIQTQHFIGGREWLKSTCRKPLNELNITRGAYPEKTKIELEKFLAALEKVENHNVRVMLEFVLFCVLERISFTHKDGQYIRWDDRSGRRVGHKKPFSKGEIPDPATALDEKFAEIIEDLHKKRSSKTTERGAIKLFEGSSLEIMPRLETNSYDGLITSPPYCNRYDYTRIYALELALLGLDDNALLALRQNLLTCTVESRAKNLLAMNPAWQTPLEIAAQNTLLQKILEYLENEKAEKRLNNNGVLRMVRGYFDEMACVIFESARVLRSGAPFIMVNDNVRYAGASISVDLILSDFAQNLGFEVENILVLPDAKGNSSQQMGTHGREVLRKCVYVWRKI